MLSDRRVPLTQGPWGRSGGLRAVAARTTLSGRHEASVFLAGAPLPLAGHGCGGQATRGHSAAGLTVWPGKPGRGGFVAAEAPPGPAASSD